MKRPTTLAVLLLVFATSCVSTRSAPAGSASGAAAAQRMREYFDNGMAKIADGAVAEGARQLVSVLAERRKPGVSGSDVDEIAALAETELAKIGAALSLEAGPEWIDDANNQRTGGTFDAGTPGALQPSVILTYNMGRARSLVAGAPVVFRFERGGGTLTAAVNTNALGQATCSLGRFNDASGEQVVRASVEFRVEGFVYRFEGVMKDFVYAPPGRRAVIVALERTPTGVVQPPVILDAVFNAIKGVNLDFSQYDGALAPERFLTCFAGDPAAIRALGLENDTVYLVMALNECTQTVQIVAQGKALNMWKAPTNATIRIIRASDGKVLFSAIANETGQGNTPEKAALDGLARAVPAARTIIESRLAEIRAALAGGK